MENNKIYLEPKYLTDNHLWDGEWLMNENKKDNLFKDFKLLNNNNKENIIWQKEEQKNQ